MIFLCGRICEILVRLHYEEREKGEVLFIRSVHTASIISSGEVTFSFNLVEPIETANAIDFAVDFKRL